VLIVTAFALSIIVAALAGEPSAAIDLEVGLQGHRRIVDVGDPIFLKVTVSNRAKEPFKRSIFYIDGDTFSFNHTNPANGLSISRPNMLGQFSPSQLDPGETKHFYTWMFVPPLHNLSDPFWGPLKDGGELDLGGIYLITKSRLQQPSNAVELILEQRDAAELASLRKWHYKEAPFVMRRPNVRDFGLSLRGYLGPREVKEMMKDVAPGEIHDLLELTLKLQELHEMADDDRDAANAGLVTWLEKQVDIKRQCLVHRSHELAQGYKMESTTRVLEKLAAGQD
jgi:hypothetical protein